MTENVPYPMPVTVASGTVTITEPDKPPREIDLSITMPATTPTDIVLQVFGEQLRRKAAVAAAITELDNWPTAGDS